ncbi:hypothetical protein [Priestia megaterium]|uniref:hypothetical protein n=1 Tax=Priestia megaterium TaxID=1404 RepID=UPI000BFE8989|nr:hypothetical protein [Priestia megaterium]PGO60571.1 hypothetical protein CN981_08460 [Priestia megaterium]
MSNFYNLQISECGDNSHSDSMRHIKDIKKVHITHRQYKGMDEVEIEVNGEVVFKYDANFKGHYCMENNIQKPIEELKL